jgi:hypothetical protein
VKFADPADEDTDGARVLSGRPRGTDVGGAGHPRRRARPAAIHEPDTACKVDPRRRAKATATAARPRHHDHGAATRQRLRLPPSRAADGRRPALRRRRARPRRPGVRQRRGRRRPRSRPPRRRRRRRPEGPRAGRAARAPDPAPNPDTTRAGGLRPVGSLIPGRSRALVEGQSFERNRRLDVRRFHEPERHHEPDDAASNGTSSAT